MLDKIGPTLTCPKCSQTIKKTLSELEATPEFHCPNPNCSVTIQVQLNYGEGVKEMNQDLSDIGKIIKGLGGKITFNL